MSSIYCSPRYTDCAFTGLYPTHSCTRSLMSMGRTTTKRSYRKWHVKEKRFKTFENLVLGMLFVSHLTQEEKLSSTILISSNMCIIWVKLTKTLTNTGWVICAQRTELQEIICQWNNHKEQDCSILIMVNLSPAVLNNNSKEKIMQALWAGSL